MDADATKLQKRKMTIAATGNESVMNWLQRVGDAFAGGAARLIGEDDGGGCSFWNLDFCPQPATCMGSDTANPAFSFDDETSNLTAPSASKHGGFQKDNKQAGFLPNEKSDADFNDPVATTDDKDKSSSPPSSSPMNKNKRRLIDKRKKINMMSAATCHAEQQQHAQVAGIKISAIRAL